MDGAGFGEAYGDRRRLLGLVYGLYGRFRGSIPILVMFGFKVEPAENTNRFVLEPRGSRQRAA